MMFDAETVYIIILPPNYSCFYHPYQDHPNQDHPYQDHHHQVDAHQDAGANAGGWQASHDAHPPRGSSLHQVQLLQSNAMQC